MSKDIEISISQGVDLDKKKITSFLYKVDNDFIEPISDMCKCSSLDIWVEKIVQKAYFVLAFKNDMIVGCLIFYPNQEGDYIYCTILAVLKEFQGMHIATDMLSSLGGFAKNRKRRGIKLQCHQTNAKAYRLYRTFGFIVDLNREKKVNYIPLLWDV